MYETNFNSINLRFFRVILTFLANLLTGRLPFHHVIMASGLDPEVLHSTSYRLSADTCFSFVRIFTVCGFTAMERQDRVNFMSMRQLWHVSARSLFSEGSRAPGTLLHISHEFKSFDGCANSTLVSKFYGSF